MKLIWKGLLSKHNPLPFQEVPSEAKKLVRGDTGWHVYLLVVPLLLLAYIAILIKRPFVVGALFTKGALFLGVGLSLLFLVAHELIHAFCCPRDSKILVYGTAFGICLVPTCRLGKRRYILIAVMPAVVLGGCPLLAWLLLSNMTTLISSIVFAFSIGSLSMCIADLYNVILAAQKMTSKSWLITSGNDCYYYEE